MEKDIRKHPLFIEACSILQDVQMMGDHAEGCRRGEECKCMDRRYWGEERLSKEAEKFLQKIAR